MTNNKLQIDRMVDGELSLEEQRDLLLACESDNRWRDLALSYVESQAFGKVMRSPSFHGHRSGDSETTLKASQPTDRRDSRDKILGWNVMSVAAAVLLSLGLGYGLGWWWQSDASTPKFANIGPPKPDTAQVAESHPADEDKLRTMPFMVSDPVSDEMRQVDLPVVYASDLGPDWEKKLGGSDLPPELVRDLRAGGLNVKQTRTVTRVRLPDGRLVVVPIDYFFEQPFQ